MSDEELDRKREETQRRQNIEQNMAFVRDFLPSLWRGMFCNLMTEGWDAPDAFIILQTYIIASSCTSGINGTGK